MHHSSDRDEPNARVLADLSALADGTIDPAREPSVRELIASSSELRERYDRERRAIAALHATRAERAPERLRERIEAQRRAAERRPRLRVGPASRLAGTAGARVWGGAAAVALAAVVLALILALPNGAPGGPSVSQAASLALRGPAMPAPPPDPKHPAAKLLRNVEDVYFPNWEGLGWRAAGMRNDRLAGHAAITVYYQWRGKQIAYTIVGAPALRRPGTSTATVNGTVLQSFTSGKRSVVTWRRAGHTCVLSGIGVPGGELSKLAAWTAPGL
jgi:anti-sigma factor RsiW